MEYAHRKLPMSNWKRPSNVKEINISEISGLLPSPDYSNLLTTSSLFLNTPKNYDTSFRRVLVDALCNGIITDNTPEAAKKESTLISLHSLSPSNPRWEDPVQEWILSPEGQGLYEQYPNIITSLSNQVCEREEILPGNITIKSTIENGESFTL